MDTQTCEKNSYSSLIFSFSLPSHSSLISTSPYWLHLQAAFTLVVLRMEISRQRYHPVSWEDHWAFKREAYSDLTLVRALRGGNNHPQRQLPNKRILWASSCSNLAVLFPFRHAADQRLLLSGAPSPRRGSLVRGLQQVHQLVQRSQRATLSSIPCERAQVDHLAWACSIWGIQRHSEFNLRGGVCMHQVNTIIAGFLEIEEWNGKSSFRNLSL